MESLEKDLGLNVVISARSARRSQWSVHGSCSLYDFEDDIEFVDLSLEQS